MRVSVHDVHGEEHLYVWDGDRATSLGSVDLVSLLRSGEAESRLAEAVGRASAEGRPPSGAPVCPPLRAPGKQIFVGVNYADHVAELPPPWKMTQDPFFFSKLQTAIIGHGEPIRIPREDGEIDYEVELLVVVGRRASRISESDALDHVFGYTVVNDVTDRRIQATDNQLTWGKGIDTFCPIGPQIVLTDEIPDPSELAIWTTVNGAQAQRSNTSNMIYSIPALIAHVSQTITLEPGDTLSTGTPAGVGFAQKPPTYLRPGDSVTVGIEGIGELTNPVVAGW
jgi:2-keto-4-pentenoate hydratase/2-oxohepta-3-ene-1,7-dioic acid hydratase in catechol pathway